MKNWLRVLIKIECEYEYYINCECEYSLCYTRVCTSEYTREYTRVPITRTRTRKMSYSYSHTRVALLTIGTVYAPTKLQLGKGKIPPDYPVNTE